MRTPEELKAEAKVETEVETEKKFKEKVKAIRENIAYFQGCSAQALKKVDSLANALGGLTLENYTEVYTETIRTNDGLVNGNGSRGY